jgi:hypothetical protein
MFATPSRISGEVVMVRTEWDPAEAFDLARSSACRAETSREDRSCNPHIIDGECMARSFAVPTYFIPVRLTSSRSAEL